MPSHHRKSQILKTSKLHAENRLIATVNAGLVCLATQVHEALMVSVCWIQRLVKRMWGENKNYSNIFARRKKKTISGIQIIKNKLNVVCIPQKFEFNDIIWNNKFQQLKNKKYIYYSLFFKLPLAK